MIVRNACNHAYTYSMPQGLESVNKNTKGNTHTCVSTHTHIVV